MDYMVIDVYIQTVDSEKLNFYSIFTHDLYGNTAYMDGKTEF